MLKDRFAEFHNAGVEAINCTFRLFLSLIKSLLQFIIMVLNTLIEITYFDENEPEPTDEMIAPLFVGPGADYLGMLELQSELILCDI